MPSSSGRGQHGVPELAELRREVAQLLDPARSVAFQWPVSEIDGTGDGAPHREQERAERDHVGGEARVLVAQPNRQRERGGQDSEDEEARSPRPATVPGPPARINDDQADEEQQPEVVDPRDLRAGGSTYPLAGR